MSVLLLIPFAFAGRVERVTELQAAGAHAEVVETVAKWEAGGALGDEAAAVLALRDRSAFILAEQANTVEGWAAFRRSYPSSRLVPQAMEKEASLAFADAQAEGSSAAMRAFLAAYPNVKLRPQAEALEAGFAFQEAVEAGTPDAIATFMSAHPDSPYAANAWESLAARTPGIHVRLADGLPRLIDAVPVVDGRIAWPKMAVVAPARPTVAVNLPGTGRGETSEWWGLYAVDADGNLGATPPVAKLYADAVGVAPTFLLDLVALPGAHAARVAAPIEPLVVPGACTGKARFAYVLTAEGKRTAFPFTVDCKAAMPEDAATPVLLSAFAVAEGGDPGAAAKLWASAAELPAGRRIVEWMGTLASDPGAAFVAQRPATADVLVWDGAATTWWHPSDGGPVALAKRDGLWIADGARLWTWEPRVEAWSAPAGGGCKAAEGERTAGALVDVLGGETVAVPITTGRGGAVTPKQYGARALAVVEEGTGDGCAKPPAPVPSTVRLPGDRAAPVPPAWAGTLVAGAVGHSVVTEAPWRLYARFRPTETVGAGAGAVPVGEGGAVEAPSGE